MTALNRYLAPVEQQSRWLLPKRDLFVGLGFCLANVAAHLFWNRVTAYWLFVASAVAMTTVLVVWLVFEWRRLQMAMTKFYCIAAAFDLIAEGCFQHVHKCTSGNILCTGRMYLVFVAGWLLTAGLSLFRSRSAATPAPPQLN